MRKFCFSWSIRLGLFDEYCFLKKSETENFTIVTYFTTKQQEVLPRTKEKKPQFYRKTVATYVGQVLKLKEIGLSLNIIYPI